MELFFQMEQVPDFCNVLCDTREQALAFPMSDIRLAWCAECDLIYNVAFDSTRMNYNAAYENSLQFSEHFQHFVQSLADELISRYKLRDKDIVEIGCGQGDFLKLLAEKGANRTFGFDPGVRSDQMSPPVSRGSVTLIPEVYSEKYTSGSADFICCRQVLEHMDHPTGFLQNLRNAINGNKKAYIYFEVPNAFFTLKDMGVWDIIYEHFAYYTPRALGLLFARSGFNVLRLEERYDNQFLSVEAEPVVERLSGLSDHIPESSAQSYVAAFALEYERKKQLWCNRIDDWQRRHRRVALWGAGSKGVTFLNALDITVQRLGWVVDINPRKQGRYVVGTGQCIVGPEELPRIRPDVIIVMNPVYKKEIKRTLRELGINVQLQLA
jgi:SAM-dependent methyltransferase